MAQTIRYYQYHISENNFSMIMFPIYLTLNLSQLTSNVAPQQHPLQLQPRPPPPQRLPIPPALAVSSKENHVQ